MEEKRQLEFSIIKRVVDQHEDCTAEVVNLMVKGSRRVKISHRLKPGDRVELRLGKEGVELFAEDRYLADLFLLPEDSRIPGILRDGITYEAFLGGRDKVLSFNPEADFISIIVFYKLPGVPPVKVDLK